MAEVRKCVQCGTPFTPGREHARFCSARCRMTWNHEHAGIAAAPAVAIDWSVTAMTEAAARLAAAQAWDPFRLAAAVAETVWWVTLVDATLVRYHPLDYATALAGKGAQRQQTEETLAGLRYVRNQLGKSADPAGFVRPARENGSPAAWTWNPLPPSQQRGSTREASPYREYRAQLAGRPLPEALKLTARFLTQAHIAATQPGSTPAPPR